MPTKKRELMEAVFYQRRGNEAVRCELCPNYCLITEGKTGICRLRVNRSGTLFPEGYGRVASLALDPIEKKPLYHFYPSRKILSVGPNGCNFRCGFCQNSSISQAQSRTDLLTPEELADLACDDGSIGVAFTYSEPLVWFEYVRDSARLVHAHGGVNVLVTNGYINEEPLRELLPFIDALNIDLKSMRPEFYRNVCGGLLETVQRTIVIAAQRCHVELTNLVIPGYNDTDEDFDRLIDWVSAVGPSIPLHFSRYYPRYRFTAPETPRETLVRAYEKAGSKLRYVYIGNVPDVGYSDTRCPSCGNVLVARSFHTVHISGVQKGACSRCGAPAEFGGLPV